MLGDILLVGEGGRGLVRGKRRRKRGRGRGRGKEETKLGTTLKNLHNSSENKRR